jgi:hypothetical protein
VCRTRLASQEHQATLANVCPWRIKYDGATREWDAFNDDVLGAPDGMRPPAPDTDIVCEDADLVRLKEQLSPCFSAADWETLTAMPAADIPVAANVLPAVTTPALHPHGAIVRSPWVQLPSVISIREWRMGHAWARQGPPTAGRLPLSPGLSHLGMVVHTLGSRKQQHSDDNVLAIRAATGIMTNEDDERLSAFMALLAEVGKELLARTPAAMARHGMTSSSSFKSSVLIFLQAPRPSTP